MAGAGIAIGSGAAGNALDRWVFGGDGMTGLGIGLAVGAGVGFAGYIGDWSFPGVGVDIPVRRLIEPLESPFVNGGLSAGLRVLPDRLGSQSSGGSADFRLQGDSWSLIPMGSYTYDDGGQGGVRARIGFSLDDPSRYSKLNFKQTIYTNKALGGKSSPYIDSRPHTHPFYYSEAEARSFSNQGGFDIIFDDNPSRSLHDGYTFWRAELSLMGEVNGVYETIVTLSYGFAISSDGYLVTVPPKVVP